MQTDNAPQSRLRRVSDSLTGVFATQEVAVAYVVMLEAQGA